MADEEGRGRPYAQREGILAVAGHPRSHRLALEAPVEAVRVEAKLWGVALQGRLAQVSLILV